MEPELVGDRLAAAAASALVGRARERERLGALIDHVDTLVAFVHGPGGIGKSALVAAVLPDGPWVDGRHLEPTPAGVLAALAAVLGCEASVVRVSEELVAARALVIDSYERLGIVDGWIRNEFLPALPSSLTTVIVGRNPPNSAWRTSPGWRRLIGELVVGPLTDPDAAALLARRAVPAPLADTVLTFARGHPLALELAAEAIVRHPDLRLHGGPPPEVVEELIEVLFDDLDPTKRRAVEAAAMLRRITEPLLAAAIDAAGLSDELGIDAAWRTLRALPVTTVTTNGLELSPVVRDVAAAGVELRDPTLARCVRKRVATVAMGELESSPGWAATADLLHLVQNPIIRNAFQPPAGQQHPVERARPDDREAVLAIVERHLRRDEADVLARWWSAHPESFVVSRDDDGAVTAFSVVTEVAAVSPELVEHDPVMATVAVDLVARPLPPNGRALIARRALAADRGSDPSPRLGSMLVDMKRTYIELRPDLARVYGVSQPGSALGAVMRALGFGDPLPRPADAGTEVSALDFGPGSVDGWLARHVDTETAPDPSEGAEPSGEEALPLSRLSTREREVLAALADGLSNRELAERLFISERTANRHLSNIFTKLGVNNRTSAARIAIVAGLSG